MIEQHCSLPRSSLGPRSRDARRRPIQSRAIRIQLRRRPPGRNRPTPIQSCRRLQTPRGLRSRKSAGHQPLRLRRRHLAAGSRLILPPAVPELRARRQGCLDHVRLQRGEWPPVVCGPLPDADAPARLLGVQRGAVGHGGLRRDRVYVRSEAFRAGLCACGGGGDECGRGSGLRDNVWG